MSVALEHLGLLCAFIGAFASLFRIAHRFSLEYVPAYRKFSRADQGDWCSRINSTIHAGVIVSGMLYTLHKQSWDENMLPLKSTTLASALFCFSAGYFLFDIYILIGWGVPLWRVFVVHHIIAVLPYLIYNFCADCAMDLYLLTLFLLVEAAVIPLNITGFLEQLGYGQTRMHTVWFYVTYVSWFAARVVLPLYNIYILWKHVIPETTTSPTCIVPAAVCGHLIAGFCIGVFAFVWTPDAIAKWRAPVQKMEEYSDHKLIMRQTMSPVSSSMVANYSTAENASYGAIPQSVEESEASYA